MSLLGGMAPARRRFVLALATLVAVVASVIAAMGLTRVLTAADPVDQDELGPVIVLAGYGGNTDTLEPIVDLMGQQGRDVWVFPPVGDNRGDIAEQAEELGTFIDEVRSETSASSVDLVGYSAGGVVARLWVRDQGGDAVARRVVTIGSPHHGTGVASLATEAGGCPVACEQLLPDSDLLRALNAGDETPQGPEWVTFRTELDQTVTPSTSADLEGALNIVVQEYCPDATTSHGQLPSSEVVIAALPDMVGIAQPTSPARESFECR